MALHREERRRQQHRLVVIVNISYLIAILITGIVLISVTAWMISANLWLCPVLNLIYVTPWLAMAIGFGNITLSVIGTVLLYLGRTRGTFQPFMIGTGVLVVGLVVVLILSIKAGIDIQEPKFRTSLYDLFVEAKTEFHAKDFGRSALRCWHNIQNKHHCCGGHSPLEWKTSQNTSTNGSAEIIEGYEAPFSCHCPPAWLRSDANASCNFMFSIAVYRVGCIDRIVSLAQEHVVVLKVIAPCIAIFTACHVALALFMAIRSRRLSAVDVYANGQNQVGGGEEDGEYHQHHRLRRNRFAADVSGVAPFALELETTQGCA